MTPRPFSSPPLHHFLPLSPPTPPFLRASCQRPELNSNFSFPTTFFHYLRSSLFTLLWPTRPFAPHSPPRSLPGLLTMLGFSNCSFLTLYWSSVFLFDHPELRLDKAPFFFYMPIPQFLLFKSENPTFSPGRPLCFSCDAEPPCRIFLGKNQAPFPPPPPDQRMSAFPVFRF